MLFLCKKTNSMERRNFISLIGTTLIASPVLAQLHNRTGSTLLPGEYKFPELPYAYNALEPYIDAKTVELHYDKHHRGYFTKFTDAIKGRPEANLPIEELFAKTSSLDIPLRNNGGGFYNHTLYWENMNPEKTNPSDELKKAIERDFGSFEKFRENFGNAAKTQFGSGWTWLVADHNEKLFISTTPNQDNPLMDVVGKRGTPLLALDVWEHAYYLHYQNRRADYVDNFWNIVNWAKVSERFRLLKK